MRLTLTATLLNTYKSSLATSLEQQTKQSIDIANKYMDGAPTLPDNLTEESLNEYVKQLMTFLEELPNKRIGADLYGYLRVLTVDMVMANILQLHTNAENAIFELGLVEECQTQS